MKNKKIKAKELDEIFDKGDEDILKYADIDSALKRINVDFPTWVVKKLDAESKRTGSSRQAVIRQIVISYFDQKELFELEKKKIMMIKSA